MSNSATSQQPPIHILGAGSVGLLWAAKLSAAGKTVSLIMRSSHPRDMDVSFTEQQTQYLYPIQTGQINDSGVIELLLVCTKAFDAMEAVQSVAHRFNDNTQIVLLQNGMGFHQPLVTAFPTLTFYAGISTEGALKSASFSVTHTGIGNTNIGVIGGAIGCHSSAAKQLLKTLSCGLKLQIRDNIDDYQWQKLLINTVINPLTVYFDCLNGALAEIPEAQLMQKALIVENRRVLQTLGYASVLDNIEAIINNVIQQTANNSSSMREDVKQHKHTEIDYINGYIIEQATRLAIPVPTHRFLQRFIHQA